MMEHPKCLNQLQIIDALNHPEYIMAALNGERLGTIICKHHLFVTPGFQPEGDFRYFPEPSFLPVPWEAK